MVYFKQDYFSLYRDDVIGHEEAKQILTEALVYPFLRPDYFKGLRGSPTVRIFIHF